MIAGIRVLAELSSHGLGEVVGGQLVQPAAAEDQLSGMRAGPAARS
jgi:hypothetical protein